jgi:DNA repair exonuclease SbcCD ATPase subunit
MNDTCAQAAPLVVERALGLTESPQDEKHVASCPSCQELVRAADEAMKLTLPAPLRAPEDGWQTISALAAKRRQHVTVVAPRVSLACSFCRGSLTREEAVFCAGCIAPHHRECFAEYGQCAILGCGSVRTVVSATGRRRRAALVLALVGASALAGAALQGAAFWLLREPNAPLVRELQDLRRHREEVVATRKALADAYRAEYALQEKVLEGARADVDVETANQQVEMDRARADYETANARVELARKRRELAEPALERLKGLVRGGQVAPDAVTQEEDSIAQLVAEEKIQTSARDLADRSRRAVSSKVRLAKKKVENGEELLEALGTAIEAKDKKMKAEIGRIDARIEELEGRLGGKR